MVLDNRKSTGMVLDNRKRIVMVLDNRKSTEMVLDNIKITGMVLDNRQSTGMVMDNRKRTDMVLDNRKSIDMVLDQSLYSGQIEIWTTQKMAKNRDKSGQFNNFPAQAARKLTKSGRNRDRLYLFPSLKILSQFLSQGNLKSGQNRDNVPKIGTSKGPVLDDRKNTCMVLDNIKRT
jgi:hypothetical protein